jgi:hypothetical protein
LHHRLVGRGGELVRRHAPRRHRDRDLNGKPPRVHGMIGWLKTAQGMLATSATVLAVVPASDWHGSRLL